MPLALERISCCVPFCRHMRRNDHGWAEWICGDHWRLVPKEYRRVHGRFQRQARRGFGAGDMSARAKRIWTRLKRYAIERAGGLG